VINHHAESNNPLTPFGKGESGLKPAVDEFTRILGDAHLLNQPIIFSMGPNPEPDQVFFNFNCYSPIFDSNPCRPIPPNLLQMQGWVSRILLQQLEIFICQFLNLSGEFLITLPKRRVCKVFHSSLHFPARKSAMAWLARCSSFPDLTSSSNCRSQASAVNSSNHSLKRASSSIES